MEPTLFDTPAGPRTIDERFWDFHEENPEVFAELCKLALRAKRRGLPHYSMKGLFELVRWHVAMRTRGQEPFKLNNDFTSRYARLLMDAEPELKGFFETRRIRS